MKSYTITKDINADYKKLRILERKGFIKIINIRIENNKDKVSAILPTGVFDHTVLGAMRFGSAKQSEVFEKLKQIVGNGNIEDCIHLEAHIRDKYDYFITEDKDILDKRNELENEFKNLKILTVNELIKILVKEGRNI